jgi:hypothetical protein
LLVLLGDSELEDPSLELLESALPVGWPVWGLAVMLCGLASVFCWLFWVVFVLESCIILLIPTAPRINSIMNTKAIFCSIINPFYSYVFSVRKFFI